MEEFAVFGIIYEVSMLSMKEWAVHELQVGLGFSSCEEKPFSENNRYLSRGETPIAQDNSLWCWPKTELKQTVFTREELPDNRHRVFVSNRLLNIAKSFAEDLTKIKFQVEHMPETSRKSIESALAKVIDNCQHFKSKASPGNTILDQERFKHTIVKVNKIIKEIDKINKIEELKLQFEKCIETYKDLVHLAQDPQESFPMIILTLRKGEKVLCYAKIHARDVIFSTNENEKGQYCAKIQTVLLNKLASRTETVFAGKMDVLLWLGPYKSVGYGILSIPRGYQDISRLTSFPEFITYTELHNFVCRVHLYQGHFLPCDDFSGTCSVSATVYFDCKSATSSVKEVLSPVWMETLIIKDVKIFASIESISNNPLPIVLEVWNIGAKGNNLLGRHFFAPTILEKEQVKRPTWYKIHHNKHIKGEILATFELLRDKDSVLYGEGDVKSETKSIPEYIKYRTMKYRLEVLLWGIRGSNSLPISSLNNPSVVINCGPVKWISFSLKNPSSFPNFNQPVFITEMDLPEDWLYAPPFIVRLFDNRSFGTEVFIGSHIVANIHKFVRRLPKAVEWKDSILRASSAPRFSQEFKFPDKNDKNEFVDTVEKTPLANLLHDVEESKVNKKFRSLKRKVSECWKSFCFCFYTKGPEEESGYISLGLFSSIHDPDVDEEFFDWWTKYYDSHPDKPNKDKDVMPAQGREFEHNEEWKYIFKRSKISGLKFYTSELEVQPEFEGFEDVLSTFKLTKPSWRRQTDTGVFKGSVALYKTTEDFVTMEGVSLDEGYFSGVSKELGAIIPLVVRVYVIKAHNLSKTEIVLNPFVEVCFSEKNKKSDIKNYIKNSPKPVFGSCYELKGRLPYDSTLTVRVMNKKGCSGELIGETEIDIENRYYSRHRATCGLQRVYHTEGYNAWRDAEKPTEILTWKCLSNNLPLPEYGTHYVTLLGRMFLLDKKQYYVSQDPEMVRQNLALTVLQNWSEIPVVGCKLLEEHVETRSLYSPLQPGIEKGKVEMWVDIFAENAGLTRPVDVTQRVAERYELRAVVWSTTRVKLLNVGTVVGKRNTDIFVKGWLKGKEDMQRTDVHFASLTGEGSFNWRFVFEFAYDRQERLMILEEGSNKMPPILCLQVWDLERLKSNEYIGSLTLDIRDIPPPSKRFPWTRTYVPMKGWKKDLFRDRVVRGSWPFLQKNADGSSQVVGMVDLELSLLTSLEAERSPAGRGRNDPDALPPPVRPIVKYTVWIVPFRAIKNFLWTYHKGTILKGLFIFALVIFVIIIIYAFPNYTVKKLLGA